MDPPPPGSTEPSPLGRGYVSAPLWTYPIVFVALLGAGVVIGEVADIDRQIAPDSLDQDIMDWVLRHRGESPSVTRLFSAVTRLGNPNVATSAIVVIAVLMFVLHRRGVYRIRRGEAWFWIMLAGGGRLLSILLKLWFRRERPPPALRLVTEDTFSFPSGHSIFAAVCFVLTAVLLTRSLPAVLARFRVPLIAACLTISLLVAASRIWLGVHYLSDVLGGFALGLTWASACCAIRFGWDRWHRRRRGRLAGEASGGPA